MDIFQLQSITQNFLHELQDAYNGKKTSLPFIVHQISQNPIVGNGEDFKVFVIGGTQTKTATLRKKENNIKILDNKQNKVSFKTEEDFLSFTEDKIGKDIRVIALNFAYPMTPVFENGRLDGVLMAATKEGKFKDLVGKRISREIENYVFKKRGQRINVSVGNDTICLLLSGLTHYPQDRLGAGIVGTGLNFALFLDKDKSVNLESANFDNFPQSTEGKGIDLKSDRPGKSLFEKETAGAYLYKHFNLMTKKRGIDYPKISSTEELDSLSRKNTPQISRIAQSLLERSAQLVACQVAGILRFAQNDKKSKSMVFNMEGSLFWKANSYKETVEKTVKQLIPKYNIRFVEIENSAILGAAKLVS